jgi:hypothetical protein
MEISLRPWLTTGLALVSASTIAIAPVSPTPRAVEMHAPTVAFSPEVHLTALEIPYILTLPILRQQFQNWVENWAVYLGGLAKSGAGLVNSLLAFPAVTVEIVQQVLALDFVGAFNTIAQGARDTVVAVGQPLLESLIWRNQKYFAEQTALEAARPQAFIDIANGFLSAGNGVTTSLIQGTQDFVAAVLTLNLANIVDAAVNGTRNFIVALGEGASAIVSGIEAAQRGIAEALATPPPPSPFVDDAVLSTAGATSTFSLARTSNVVTLNTVAPDQDQTSNSETDAVAEPADGPALSLVEDSMAGTPDPVAPVQNVQEPTTAVAHIDENAAEAEPPNAPEVAPARLPKKPVRATTVVKTPKRVDQTVDKVTDGAAADATDTGVGHVRGGKKDRVTRHGGDAGVKPAAGADADAKPAAEAAA